MTGFLSFNSDDPWTRLANKVWGLGFIAVVIALVNSGLAGSNASSTATTRVGYAMGRVGLLPRVFTTVNDRYKTPTWAVHVQALFALALIPVLLAAFGIDFAHLGITGLTYPADLAPLICLAWMALGLVLLGAFMVRDRSRIAETRRVFTEETPAERESVR